MEKHDRFVQLWELYRNNKANEQETAAFLQLLQQPVFKRRFVQLAVKADDGGDESVPEQVINALWRRIHKAIVRPRQKKALNEGGLYIRPVLPDGRRQ
jgi:hypothetical protein